MCVCVALGEDAEVGGGGGSCEERDAGGLWPERRSGDGDDGDLKT